MRISQRIFGSDGAWLIQSQPIQLLKSLAEYDDGAEKIVITRPPPYTVTESGVAVVPVNGVVVRTATELECYFFGLVSMASLSATLAKLDADPAIRAIALAIDSPGGEACGTPEAGADIAGIKKPIVAHSSGMMASAAYWLGSQCDYVAASPSAYVGSIGVISTYFDYTAMLAAFGVKADIFQDGDLKSAGSPYKPKTNEERAYLQAMTEEIGAGFRAAVRSKMPRVSDDAMQGQLFLAPSALSAGLLHEVTSLQSTIRAAEALAQIQK